MAFRVSCPGMGGVYTIAADVHLREDDARERHSCRDRADAAGRLRLLLRHARSGLALRDAGVAGHPVPGDRDEAPEAEVRIPPDRLVQVKHLGV